MKFWLKIENNKLHLEEGKNKFPDITIILSKEGAVKLFSEINTGFGEYLSTLFRSGTIRVRGNTDDTVPLLILLRFLLEITKEELKDKKAKNQ